MNSTASPMPGKRAASLTTATLRICTDCYRHGLQRPRAYEYVILHSNQARLMHRLKRASPRLKTLMYVDMAATVDYTCHNGRDDAHLPTGVGYCWAAAHHPEWFLTDTTGARVNWCDYPMDWQMDIDNAGYRARWLRYVAAEAKRGGWDGVMIDDVADDASVHLCGRVLAKYPTASDYARATGRFLATVAPRLRRLGLLVLPNIALADPPSASSLARWTRWTSYSSGAVQEYFSKDGRDSSEWYTDSADHPDWSVGQRFFRRTQARHKIFIGITYAPAGDVQSMRYARASFLLDWDGGPSALAFEPTNPEAQDPYSREWTIHIGRPSGRRRRVGTGWRRDYTQGVVAINPSPTTTQTFPLAKTYAFSDGTRTSSLTLAPATAVIVRLPNAGRTSGRS
jgi:Hypothetical glycosyl hydrolase family 15